jgi:ribonuclease-3
MAMSPYQDLRRTLERHISYTFANKAFLDGALTHPSAAQAAKFLKGGAGYERLEFLGDRVLGLVIAELLLEHFPKENEGALSKRFVALVRKEALLEVAKQINLTPAIDLAPGSGQAFDRQQETAAADGVEALIGGIFQDGGYDPARTFIRAWWFPLLGQFAAPPKDPKTALQEWAQGKGLPLPEYQVRATAGPDHQPTFEISAEIAGYSAVEASGRSKRAAEQAAAEALLAAIDAGSKT